MILLHFNFSFSPANFKIANMGKAKKRTERENLYFKRGKKAFFDDVKRVQIS